MESNDLKMNFETPDLGNDEQADERGLSSLNDVLCDGVGSELLMDINRYLTQLAPHVAKRDAAQLLRRCKQYIGIAEKHECPTLEDAEKVFYEASKEHGW